MVDNLNLRRNVADYCTVLSLTAVSDLLRDCRRLLRPGVSTDDARELDAKLKWCRATVRHLAAEYDKRG